VFTGDTYVNSIAVPILRNKQYRIGACNFDARNAWVRTHILNHTNFAAPNFLNDANNSAFDPTGVPLSNFGVIGSTATTSRQIQLGLKLIF
jgi:hypothetical protein